MTEAELIEEIQNNKESYEELTGYPYDFSPEEIEGELNEEGE